MPPSIPRPEPEVSTMKIRELKAELASHGICTGNILEKSELVRAVHEARKAAATKRQKERGDHDDIAPMSVKQLKIELEKCGISPSQFFEKGDMQEALRSARSINTAAPPSVFPASLSESFGTKPQPSARTTSRSSASTSSNSRPKKPTPPQRSNKVSDQYTWSSSKVSSSDVKSSTSSSRRSARRHSSEKRSQPGASCCDTSALSQDGDMKRMPKSFFPVNTFDSGTAGGEPMGGNPGAGLGSSVGGDADGNTDATNKTVAETTFIPASFKRAPAHRKSQRMSSRDGKRNDVKRREYDARAPAQQSPSSVANNSLEQDARPEWLQM